MPESELCWKCREKITGKVITTNDVNRDILIALYELSHCHHEPKEKPFCKNCGDFTPGKIIYTDDGYTCSECGREILKKEKPKCWCDLRRRLAGGSIVADGDVAQVNFCLQCGRKL